MMVDLIDGSTASQITRFHLSGYAWKIELRLPCTYGAGNSFLQALVDSTDYKAFSQLCLDRITVTKA